MAARRRGGQKIPAEDRYEETGLTSAERDAVITKMHNKGYTQYQIAAKLGITQPAVHYALLRLAGKSRPRAKYELCDWCAERVPKGTLDENGCCQACADG